MPWSTVNANANRNTKNEMQADRFILVDMRGPLQMVVVYCHYSLPRHRTELKLLVNKISYFH